MWRVGLTVWVVLAIGVGVSVAQPPVDEPADPPAQTEVQTQDDDGEGAVQASAPDAPPANEGLARLISSMEAAETEAAVDDLFGEACRIDRDDAGVNRAYLRRMLQFGQVQKAVYAARRLLKSNDEEGMAFATLAYYEASRGYLRKAFPEAIQAANLLPEDPGVMTNAGALAAWYAHQDDAPPIPRELRRAMRENLAVWQEDASFAESYLLVDEQMKAYDEQTAETEAEIEEINTEIRPIDAEIDSLSEEADYYTNKIDGYKDRIADWQEEMRNTTSASRDNTLRRYISDYRALIRKAERDRSRYVKQIRERDRERTALEVKRRAAERDLKEIEQNRKGLLGVKDDRVEWELPRVDGERIDLDELRAAKAQAAREARQTPSGDTSEAGKAMQMARQYVRAGRGDLAVPLLEKVIRIDPDSDLAAEAETILRELARQ